MEEYTNSYIDNVLSKREREDEDDVFIRISNVQGSKYPVTLKHQKCQQDFEVLASSIVRGIKTCPICKKNSVLNKCKEYAGEEYSIVGDGTDEVRGATPVIITHLKCGTSYRLSECRNVMKDHYKCPVCNVRKTGYFRIKSLASDNYKKEVEELWNGEYTVLSEYVNNRHPITVKHNVCGRVLQTNPHHFKNGHHACRICSSQTEVEFRGKKYDSIMELTNEYGIDYYVFINAIKYATMEEVLGIVPKISVNKKILVKDWLPNVQIIKYISKLDNSDKAMYGVCKDGNKELVTRAGLVNMYMDYYNI